MSGLVADVRLPGRVEARVEVAAGDTLAVMGPSGAGKSSLLAAIAGTARMDAGEIRIGDRIVAGGAARVAMHRRGAVLLGQEPRLFPHLSARDNVAFGLRARRVGAAAASARAEELLARVGLAGREDVRPAELSGGQQQRVALARALAVAPSVMLLDEPLTSLDAETAGGIRTVLQDLLRGVTTILVTHDALDAAALGDRLAVLEDGALTQIGPVREVLGHPATGFAATIAGLNRVVGVSAGGACVAGDAVIAGSGVIAGAGAEDAASADGARVAAVFRPGDVRLERVDGALDGDIREAGRRAATPGAWTARVTRLEPTPAGVRVHTADPPLAVDLPVDDAVGLSPGARVRLSVPAAAVRLLPA